jgi:cyclin K
MQVMATCCLFLAGKVEETPKKCKDMVKTAKQWLEAKSLKKHADNFGDDPIKEIMIYERILLQTIKFDLQLDHPYSYLLKYAKTLKGDQEQIRNMVQMAWTFINDSFSTTLCLQWEPEIIAIALMFLTSKLSKLEITDWLSRKENIKQNWWDQFVEGLGIDILEDICHQILDLYTTQQQQQQQSVQKASTTTSSNSVSNDKNVNNSNPASVSSNLTNTKSNKRVSIIAYFHFLFKDCKFQF